MFFRVCLWAWVWVFLLRSALCPAQVTIYRDAFGVPSIEAPSLRFALYGLGYAMAQDCAVQMARNYRLARGRLAEVDGRRLLLQDGLIRSLGIEALAEQKARTLSGPLAELLVAFCAGANRALAEQRARLPDWVEPFTPVDVLANVQLINIAFPLYDIAGSLLPGAGSNQFAVAGRRSASGHALLSMDPHLPWSEPFLWYEFALYTPDLAFRGITVPGAPLGVMGHNDRVAWCMTNNDPDLYDLFTVRVNPDNPGQYSYHGVWRDFEEVTQELRWREDGQMRTQTQRVRRTAWGPLLPFRLQALRIAPLGTWDVLEQTLEMMRARDVEQFRAALQRRGLSMWNMVYADVTGRIGYQYNAHLPRRDPDVDWRRPVPGDTPRTQWGALWSLDDLPHIVDPPSGLLVNANSSPWLTPVGAGIRSGGWPAYVTSQGRTSRYTRLAELLGADPSVSVAEAKRYATDTLIPGALATVARLQQAAARRKDRGSGLRDALAILGRWNGRADAGSAGAPLYAAWLRTGKLALDLAQKVLQGRDWTAEEQEAALVALQQAVEAVRRDHGSVRVLWGQVQRAQRGDVVVPVAGFNGPGDIVAVMPTWGSYRDGTVLATGGSSFRMLVELDPSGVRSWSVLPYGNAQDPASPHYADQMRLYGRGEYKPTHFGLKSARRHARSRTTLQPAF